MNKRALLHTIENPLHRSMGRGSATIPMPPDSEKLLYARMLGTSSLTDDGSLIGVGDFDESSGKYNIPMHIVGRNLLDENLFIERYSATGLRYTLSDETFSYWAEIPYIGTVLLDNNDIKFKPKTQYTLMAKCNFLLAELTGYCVMQLAFRYTDGSMTDISFKSDIPENTMVFTSEKNKTVDAIVCAYTRAGAVRLYRGTMGIFEGKLTDYDSEFAPYNMTEYTLTLDRPLCGIGYISDEIDMLSKTLTRKVTTATLNGDCTLEASEHEGIFKLYLDTPRMSGTDALSLFPIMELDALANAEYGISLPDSEDYIYIKTGAADTDGALAYLEENPILLHYILRDRTSVPIQLNIPYQESYTTVVIRSATEPRRIFYEYI